MTHLLLGHSQEICGLSWCSSRSNFLATGGNDNQVGIWDIRGGAWLGRVHRAGVKAVSWKDDQLLTAGGLKDKRVVSWKWCPGYSEEDIYGQPYVPYEQFDNRHEALTRGYMLGPMSYQAEVASQSQICGVVWTDTNIPVTAHGFTQNCIATWKFQPLEMKHLVRMHNKRCLFIAGDGYSRVATGAGDGTVKVFTVGEQANIRQSQKL